MVVLIKEIEEFVNRCKNLENEKVISQKNFFDHISLINIINFLLDRLLKKSLK